MSSRKLKQEVMFAMIENWSKSGQSVQAFCKIQGVAYCVFHYWRKRYEQGSMPDPESSFIPVQLDNTRHDGVVAELIFPDGRRMNFYKGIDAGFLRALLA
jgi:hypothetical protein